jgi:probable HAF family extracellular repeat protein
MNIHLLMNERSFIERRERWDIESKSLNNRKREIEMKKSSLFLVGLMACLAIGVSTARGQVFYTLEDLGVIKGMEASQPAALNNLGDVAGTAHKGQETCAFHYDYIKKFMADAGGVNSRAFGISSIGMVVGDSYFPPAMEPKSHAALFKSGFAMDLGVLEGQLYSRANGINAMGQAVGYSGQERDSSESLAFMWSYQTGMINLGTLGGAFAQAYAINDAGYITGTAQTQAIIPTTHAFIYAPPSATGGSMRDLGVLAGNTSYGMAINRYNHVAGYSTIKPNETRVHAFLHNGKSMIDLGSLGGEGSSDASVALSINTFDQVVGYTYLPTPQRSEMPLQQVAFLWRPYMGSGHGGGQMINLNKLLTDLDRQNYLLIAATAINDNGQIVASAYDLQNGGLRAVLLTPQGPAPTVVRDRQP